MALLDLVSRRPLAAGWIWTALWAAGLGVAELVDAPSWLWMTLAALLVAPVFACAVVVLARTPREHLRDRETILSHFLLRFATLVAAFIAWTVSVIIGASLSSALQLAAENREDEVLLSGFSVLWGLFPLVLGTLWLTFVFRSAWFLARLRGWRSTPCATSIPDRVLALHPRWRRTVIGMAHPALLMVAGTIATIVAIAVGALDITLELLV